MVKPYIASKLISWQKQAGRHNLPWQKTNDAYQIWISEMMLQQTQVKTVIPYFNKFIQTFPNINRLADAQEDEVMEHWSGLGYYRRAKFIMQSAKIVVEKYHSRFPMKVEDLMTLPGIGRSTAGAICALAFKNPAPILYANVVRVFCRFYGINETSSFPSSSPSQNVRQATSHWTGGPVCEDLAPAARFAAHARCRHR